ncbi:hypothetical protein J6590_003255 [Homalodisca vitripennis]|nr:hypothetical protein J6590_003255 [Homalodisca vitripennis]
MEDSLIRKASPGEARLKGRHPENWKKTKEKKQSEGCPNFDWKQSVTEIQKKPANWHFQFNPSKRIKLKLNRVKNIVYVRGEMNYRTNLNVFRSVLKSGKSYEALDPTIIQPGRAINQAKLTDVKKLLTAHFGNGWERLENLSFYTKLAEVGRDAEEDDEKSVQTLNWKTHYNSHVFKNMCS